MRRQAWQGISIYVSEKNNAWKELIQASEAAIREGKLDEAERLLKTAVGEAAEHCSEELGHAVGDARLAESFYRLGVLFSNQMKTDEAEQMLKRSLEIREKLHGPVHEDVSVSLLGLSAHYATGGRYYEAEMLTRRSLEILESLGHDAVSVPTSCLAQLYCLQSRFDEAEAVLLEHVSNCEQQESSKLLGALSMIATFYEERQDCSKSNNHLSRALDIAVKQMGADSLEAAEIELKLAEVHLSGGDLRKAESLLIAAIETFQKKMLPNEFLIGRAKYDLARLYCHEDFSGRRFQEVESLYQAALSIFEEHLGHSNMQVGLVLLELASLYETQEMFELSEPLHQRVLEIVEQKVDRDDVKAAAFHVNLAGALFEQGKLDMAETHLKQALSLKEKESGSDHIDTAELLVDLAKVYRKQERLLDAEAALMRSKSIRERILGPTDPSIVDLYIVLANIYLDQNMPIDLEKSLTAALAILRGPEVKRDAVYGERLSTISSVYVIQGKFSDAEAHLVDALKATEQASGEVSPEVADRLLDLAELYCLQDKKKDVESLCKRSLDIADRCFAPMHIGVGNACLRVARLMDQHGSHARSDSLLEQGIRIYKEASGSRRQLTAILELHVNVLNQIHKTERAGLIAARLKKIREWPR